MWHGKRCELRPKKRPNLKSESITGARFVDVPEHFCADLASVGYAFVTWL